MPVEDVAHRPDEPDRELLRVDSETYPTAVRAVVVGLVGLGGQPAARAVLAARAALDDGAVAVELGGRPDLLHTVLADASRGETGLPVWRLGCTVDSPEALDVASELRVGLITVADGAPRGSLQVLLGEEAVAGPWRPTVIAPPDVCELLAPWREPPGGGRRLVCDATLVRGATWPGDRAESSASRCVVPGTVPGATVDDAESDVVAATTVAVAGGARVVRTRWVRHARRAADLVATLLMERSGTAPPLPGAARGGAR